jgi:hypothetical protein
VTDPLLHALRDDLRIGRLHCTAGRLAGRLSIVRRMVSSRTDAGTPNQFGFVTRASRAWRVNGPAVDW